MVAWAAPLLVVGAASAQVAPGYAGTPGAPNCHGQSIARMAQDDGGLRRAAELRHFESVRLLQLNVSLFCIMGMGM
ncbi:MAG: hypothetical protein A2148_01310 [Chloroflexi bacterium RBG_16_68_14]|nr:MAG: hypothetical protein A2148_01310 [Chloroflexi bacterium RBG_16_68_14]